MGQGTAVPTPPRKAHQAPAGEGGSRRGNPRFFHEEGLSAPVIASNRRQTTIREKWRLFRGRKRTSDGTARKIEPKSIPRKHHVLSISRAVASLTSPLHSFRAICISSTLAPVASRIASRIFFEEAEPLLVEPAICASGDLCAMSSLLSRYCCVKPRGQVVPYVQRQRRPYIRMRPVGASSSPRSSGPPETAPGASVPSPPVLPRCHGRTPGGTRRRAAPVPVARRSMPCRSPTASVSPPRR